MGDLQVDYYQLENGSKVAGELKAEFDGIEDSVSDSLNVWSHDAVRDALGEFKGNMDYNRKKLSQKLEDCKGKMDATLAAFRESDQQLADQFDQERAQ